MEKVLKVTLWGEEVAAVLWDNERNLGVLEFFESFIEKGYDIAPLMMPLVDLRRGELIYSFPELSSKTFRRLPGLIADSLLVSGTSL